MLPHTSRLTHHQSQSLDSWSLWSLAASRVTLISSLSSSSIGPQRSLTISCTLWSANNFLMCQQCMRSKTALTWTSQWSHFTANLKIRFTRFTGKVTLRRSMWPTPNKWSLKNLISTIWARCISCLIELLSQDPPTPLGYSKLMKRQASGFNTKSLTTWGVWSTTQRGTCESRSLRSPISTSTSSTRRL